MSGRRLTKRWALILLSSLLITAPGAAQIVVLHSFAAGPNDGAIAPGSLVASGSTLYGMTEAGGSLDNGAVFKINNDGTGFTLLHSFQSALNDGSTPNGSLALSGTTLYGLTQFGGSATSRGTAFSINIDGTGFRWSTGFRAAAPTAKTRSAHRPCPGRRSTA
jgi:uncharacterized repeat protein (TIGR03803 family)